MKYLLFNILIFANINLYVNFLNNLTPKEYPGFKFIKNTLKTDKDLNFGKNDFFKKIIFLLKLNTMKI
ncbi:hypothetical protein [Borreliella turdi]|uniref:hypothetical protein n=1 Tax=Borreliella turdi TaxID=57863 RepID=UPI003AEF685B